jgi:large subunit ribosomal protein L10
MPKPEKIKKVNEIKDKIQSARLVLLTDYRGLNVKEINELRTRLKKVGIEYKVVKNTLTKIACNEIGLDELKNFLTGPVALALEKEGESLAAKVLFEFSKEHKALEVKCGLLDKKIIKFDEVKKLAELPPKEVIISNLQATLQFPIQELTNLLSGLIRNLLYALECIKSQKERGGNVGTK